MSKVIASPYVLPPLSNIQLGENIAASTHKGLLNVDNALFGNAGVCTPGRFASSGSPLLRYTSTTYAQIAATSGSEDPRAVLGWNALSRGWRYLSGANALQFELEVYAQDVDIRLTAAKVDGGPALSKQLEITAGAAGWYRGQLIFTALETTLAGDPRGLVLYLEVRVDSPATEGYVWGWLTRERVLRPGDESLLPNF
jgi:hypothetical protein